MNRYTSIQELEGGYIVTTDGKSQIVTSLNKAVKIVREYLNGGAADDAAE